MNGYVIPAGPHRTEILVVNSRFYTSIGYAPSVDAAKAFISSIRAEMPDANHHVYAFRVGYGNSIIEGVSDDGEPTGTSGPPVLAVLRGRDIGDTVVVVTRFFGGTKLGTGGLVRAYTDAAQEGFRSLAVIRRIERTLLGLELPYPVFEQVKRLIAQHGGEVEEESFAEAVTILAKFPSDQTKPFSYAVSELTSGRVVPIDFGSI
jgi:uncharacterized YigZ family protein